MVNLRFWLIEQGMKVRELARDLDVPLTTVEDWVYRGASPSEHNAELLYNFVRTTCTHHWLIEAPNGPVSKGVCRRCGEGRGFRNSAEYATPWLLVRTRSADSATKLKES